MPGRAAKAAEMRRMAARADDAKRRVRAPASGSAPTRLEVRLKTAAELSDVNVQTLRRWISTGQLRAVRRGWRISIAVADLKAFMRKSREPRRPATGGER